MKFHIAKLFLTITFIWVYNLYAQQGAYVNPISVIKGDTLQFYISTKEDPFNIQIFKDGYQKQLITTINSVKGGLIALPDSSFQYGCNWPLSLRFKIPENWLPGVYLAEFPISSGTKSVLFVVKEKNLGSYSSICVALSVFTWQAYNNFGGKSFYCFNSTSKKYANKLSFNRPFAGNSGCPRYFKWESKLVSWLDNENVPVEFLTDIDLHESPDILNNYDVLIIAGHNEYWTRKKRLEIEKFVNKGGKLIILSGNTCWQQTRYDNQLKEIVHYLDSNEDPLKGIEDSLVTEEWYDRPLDYPENILTGVSWRNGGIVNYKGIFPKEKGYGDYAAFSTHHWIYEGTGIEDGDEFGWEKSIVGFHTDGALFNWQNGLPAVTGFDQSPLNHRILAISPAGNWDGTKHGHATMGMYLNQNRGAVFNAATTDWVYGLASDKIVQKITMNVLERFLDNNFPPEIVSWSPFKIVAQSVNNEQVYLNKRDLTLSSGDSIKFSIHAQDPYNGNIKYFWTNNGKVTSNDSVWLYQVNKYPLQEHTVITANAFNKHDTASISWNINNNILEIVSPSEIIIPVLQTYPNPFRTSTTITYAANHPGLVQLMITNILGKEVKTLINNFQEAGIYSAKFDAGFLPDGVYICKFLIDGEVIKTIRILSIK
ncbi:T9SS type A sorting domain-containing protein [Candidatus Amoebophilus asiaticus]|nr:T9SS type A sorting domain-containing protein [Candidatus Amoebophilus asiaticus]